MRFGLMKELTMGLEYALSRNKGTAVERGAFSVAAFCESHDITPNLFYRALREGWAPRTMLVGSRRLISVEAAAEWRRVMEEITANDDTDDDTDDDMETEEE